MKSFGGNRNLEIAATLAFYGFLSLMPLLLLTVLILRLFLGDPDEVGRMVSVVLSDLFPAFELGWLADVTGIKLGGGFGILSAALLLWSMTPFAGALRSAMAKMFKMPMRVPFYVSKLIDLGTVLSFLLLFLLLAAIKSFVPAPGADDDFARRLALASVRTALPFLFSVCFLGGFFRVFSPVRLTWHHWLLGAVTVTLLWGLMRNLFVMFVAFNPNYGYAFGSMKAIFLLIVWVYYSFAALLLGAEIMANTYRREALLLRDLLQPDPKAKGGENELMKKFERALVPGQVLFREGDGGTEMFVVLEGAIRLSRGGRELAVMRRGQYFGEMSLLGGAPRSATAEAAEPVRLAVINKSNFDLLVRENPLLVRSLLEELARRLADMNRRVEAASGGAASA